MREIVRSDLPQIRALISDILGETDYQNVERMGGLTNHTYKVTLRDGTNYVVRLPGEGTEELINRADERISTAVACELGIDAQMLYFGCKGEKVTRYIEGAQTLCMDSFKDRTILCKVAEVFRTLHTSGVDTKVPFDVFDMAAGYERIIRDNDVAIFHDYEEVKNQVMMVRNCVDKHGISLVPCHNDPLCENWVLGEDGKLYLIDWEYAGMNDAMWDLADVSIEADLSADRDEDLLRFYFMRDPNPEERRRFYANKLYLDFLWALWGKARVPFDGETMEKYGSERYERLKKNLTQFQKSFLGDQ